MILESPQSLARYLENQSHRVIATTDGIKVVLHPERAEPLVVEVFWLNGIGLLQLVVGLAVQVALVERAAVAERLCAINSELVAGSFQLRSGIVFVMSTCLDDYGAVSSRAVDCCLSSCVSAIGRYGSELEGI